MPPLSDTDPRTVGPFTVEARLGAGGMGVVYRARSRAGDVVALKVIREEIGIDPDFRIRFRREVRALRAVGGLCTARLVDADPDAERPWLATEFVDGPTLSEVVASGPLPATQARALAVGLAESLASIHAVGVVHRDLKPGNVLLGRDGPKVIDFGIAALADATSATRTGLVVGSPGYMSPEQVTGLSATGPPGDVFSWGLTVAFAATGRAPFGETDRVEALLYRVVYGSPDLEGLPPGLDVAVRAAVQRDPAHRPTAAHLVELLAPGSASPRAAATTVLREGWPAFVPPPPVRRVRTGRRTAVAVAVVSAAAALAAGGTALAVLQPWNAPPADGPVVTVDPIAGSSTGAVPPTSAVPPTAGPTSRRVPDLPRFAGEIGHLAKASAFESFIAGNDGRIVNLDVYIVAGTDAADSVLYDSDPPSFTLYTDCADAPGGKPGLGCQGTSYVVNDAGSRTDSVFGYVQGFHRLRGNFAVAALPGVHQGLVSVGLRGVPTEDI